MDSAKALQGKFKCLLELSLPPLILLLLFVAGLARKWFESTFE